MNSDLSYLFSDKLKNIKILLAKLADYSTNLTLEEKNLLAKNLNQKKINEFSTGRFLIKEALTSYSNFDQTISILKKENGAPFLPKNFIGSISHNSKYAITSVSKKEDFKAIGIDIEFLDRKIKENLIGRVILEEEIESLETSETKEQKMIRIFSAKEALFKAYNLVNQSLKFTDIKLIWDKDAFLFEEKNYRVYSNTYNDNLVISISGIPYFQS